MAGSPSRRSPPPGSLQSSFPGRSSPPRQSISFGKVPGLSGKLSHSSSSSPWRGSRPGLMTKSGMRRLPSPNELQTTRTGSNSQRPKLRRSISDASGSATPQLRKPMTKPTAYAPYARRVPEAIRAPAKAYQPTGTSDWRTQLTRHDRLGVRQKVRQAYKTQCPSYEELLLLTTAMEEQLLHIHCSNKHQYVNYALGYAEKIMSIEK